MCPVLDGGGSLVPDSIGRAAISLDVKMHLFIFGVSITAPVPGVR